MQEEIDYRIQVLRPQLIEDVKTAREFGDLSENFEYKAAKRDKNRNESRIRYLQQMIRTAVVISPESKEGEIGLFDKVTVRIPSMGNREMTYQIVTTMRADALQGRITRESPVGKALAGRREGETVHVQVSADFGYDMEIVDILKQEDDGSIPINEF